MAKSKPKTAMIHARVEQTLKVKAENVLTKLGITASDAIRIFYRQIALQKGLPFDIRIPNAATRKAMLELESGGKDLTTYKSAGEMLDDLWEAF